MANSRVRLLPPNTFVAGCFATLVVIFGYNAFQWIGSLSQPVIYVDVNDQLLESTGFSFPRPQSATKACMAIVGNGMGDTCTYFSFDISSDSLSAFLKTLPSYEELASNELRPFPYLESLPKEVSELIMPEVLPDEVEAFSIGNAVGVYDVEKERLHLHTF